jgi:hypothetical protein
LDLEPASTYRTRWIVPFLAACLLVALLVAGLTIAGLGPLASRPQAPPVEFEAADYPGDASRIELSNVATLTTATGDDVEAPSAMADGDPETAWRSDGTATDLRTEDDGEIIELVLAEPAWVERIALRNGDQLDEDAYVASARLRRIEVSFDGGEQVVVDLLDRGLESQEVVLPEPLLTTEVRIDVLEAFAGESDELALAEIALVGWRAVGEDVETAAARADAEPASGPVTPRPLSVLR